MHLHIKIHSDLDVSPSPQGGLFLNSFLQSVIVASLLNSDYIMEMYP